MSRPAPSTPTTSQSAPTRSAWRSRRVVGDGRRQAAAGAVMRRVQWALVFVAVCGLAGAVVGVVPDPVDAVAGRQQCRATAVVTGAPVSTIDVKTRTKHPSDIAGVHARAGVAVTPDGKTAFDTTPIGTDR